MPIADTLIMAALIAVLACMLQSCQLGIVILNAILVHVARSPGASRRVHAAIREVSMPIKSQEGSRLPWPRSGSPNVGKSPLSGGID